MLQDVRQNLPHSLHLMLRCLQKSETMMLMPLFASMMTQMTMTLKLWTPENHFLLHDSVQQLY
jgi:hypothetical protein